MAQHATVVLVIVTSNEGGRSATVIAAFLGPANITHPAAVMVCAVVGYVAPHLSAMCFAKGPLMLCTGPAGYC